MEDSGGFEVCKPLSTGTSCYVCVGSGGVCGPEGARKLFFKNKAKIPARLNKIYSTKTVMCKKEKNKA